MSFQQLQSKFYQKMHTATPNSTQFLEDLTRQPIFERAIDEDLKRQPFFESQDFNCMPTLPRQRVSEKLLENRKRKIEINLQKQQEIDGLLEKKREREREIYTNIRNRLEHANRKKEENLRQSYSQQQNRKKGEELETRQKMKRFQANLEKIEKGRSKVEEKKAQYIFRIHRRTEQNMRKVIERKKMMQFKEEAENDQIHLQEWNSYREKLVRKHEGRSKSPPDHLYQDFKQRNQHLKSLISQAAHKEQEQSKKVEQHCPDTLLSCASAKTLICRTKKAEYFGIHQENMINRTLKQVEKMRKFLQNEGHYQNFVQNEEVYTSFKQFFFSEIFGQ